VGVVCTYNNVENGPDLIQKARNGDREAFGSLAEACRPWLYGLCFRLVRDQGTAEDLVQETLLRTLRDLPMLRDPRRFRPWLSKIAVNVCRMHLRRLQVRPAELPLAAEESQSLPTGADSPPRVKEALAALDTTSRRVLMLYYGDELSQAEISELLALSPAAVKSRLHRARERIRKEMVAMMSEKQKQKLGVSGKKPWKLRTILLVEPDESVRESLHRALMAAGYKVIALPTGEAALAAAAERKGQLLILDKHCVEPNWIEVLTLLQADSWSRENLPVGVLVDANNARDRILAWQAGAVLCLTRPPDVQEVVGFVKRLERLWPEEYRPNSKRRDSRVKRCNL